MNMHTGLLGFKYLKWQRLLTLTLITAAASLLFSLTALSLLGFYRGFTAYLGEEENIIAIYNPKANTPYTSIVPAYLAEKLAALKGVLASSPEMAVPCLLNGKPVFLRGVIPENLEKLNPFTMVEGEALNRNDINTVMVGENLAEKLKLKLDGEILLQGIFADRYVEVRIKGIFLSNTVLDDEILAPLHVGQWLRGTDYNHVSLIRLKIDRHIVTPNEIYMAVAAESTQPTQPATPAEPQPSVQQPIIPWTTAAFSLEDVDVEQAVKYMRSYMDRYGVTKEALLTLSAAVFLFSSLTITLASKTVLAQHKGEINILRSLGVSERLLKIDLLIKLSPLVVAASLAGFFAASAILKFIQGKGYLQVLSHTVPFQLDPTVAALNVALAAFLFSISIFGEKIRG
jgi:ABC-type lipoprotein release transport system permease subunit